MVTNLKRIMPAGSIPFGHDALTKAIPKLSLPYLDLCRSSEQLSVSSEQLSVNGEQRAVNREWLSETNHLELKNSKLKT